MRRTAVISIERVLATTNDLKSAFSTSVARPLYDSLKQNFRLVLLTEADEDIARHWLEQEFLTDFALIDCHVAYLPYREWRVDRVRHYLAEGYEVSLVIDADPEVAAGCAELGVFTMLMAPPLVRSGWRQPTEEVRPWDEVASTVRTRPRE